MPHYDPAISSGANRRFAELCKRFDSGFEKAFEIIVSRRKRPAGLFHATVHEIDFPSNTILGKLKASRQIGNILKSCSPAIVINEFVPISFRSLDRHVHFQMIHDARYFTENQTLLQRLLYSQPLKHQWGKCKHILTCSEFTKGELIRFCGCRPKNIIITYNGVDEELLKYGPAPAEKEIDILFVGHFEKRKNHANLLKALAMIDRDLRVTLIGFDNGLKPQLQRLARDLELRHIQMLTMEDDQELWECYRRSRLFVFPSHYEGFGIPLIESLALGTPVACSDIPVFREIGGPYVVYFDQQDPETMASVISGALAHPRILSSAESANFLRPFLWDTVYRKLVDDLTAASAGLQPS